MHASNRRSGIIRITTFALSSLFAACQSPGKQLERVAKDWCLTIRASQVLPVYPLTEDLQPGDVFLVATPLARQTELYEERGFLALDQQVTRLANLDYSRYYGAQYWSASYAPPPNGHTRPAKSTETVVAPRAAFPSYNFEIDRSSGISLAIPIQGVPVGLGLMGARRATGSVSLDDAYTYGVDGAEAYDSLLRWWAGLDDGVAPVVSVGAGDDVVDPGATPEPIAGSAAAVRDEKGAAAEITAGAPQAGEPTEPRTRATGEVRAEPDVERREPHLVSDALSRIAAQSNKEVYLRVVTRVFLVRSVTVSLANLDSSGGGGDAGIPQAVQMPDLSTLDPREAEAAATAYSRTLAALSGAYNGTGAGPGGSFRFTQVGRRSVTLSDTFDCPLVVGYLGFDVKVYPDGRLSAPIPSFSVLTDEAPSFVPFTPILDRYEWYAEWLEEGDNRDRMKTWLAGRGFPIDPADLLRSEYDQLFELAARELRIFSSVQEVRRRKR